MDYLSELCADLEIDPRLGKTEGGRFVLPLNSELMIEIQPLKAGFYFYSPVRPCPKVKKEELLIQLMKANLFGQGTKGAALGLEGKENVLTLSLAIPYDMKYKFFREALEDFANIVNYWREEVDRHIQQAESGIF